jgi:hypothetical protein
LLRWKFVPARLGCLAVGFLMLGDGRLAQGADPSFLLLFVGKDASADTEGGRTRD